MMPNSNELLLKQSVPEKHLLTLYSVGFQLAKINDHFFTGEDFISALPQIPESIIQQNYNSPEMAVLDFYLSIEAQKGIPTPSHGISLLHSLQNIPYIKQWSFPP